MNSYRKTFIKMGLLSILSVLPLTAQVGNGVQFEAPFPFYVGDTKMPAGSYILTEPSDPDFHVIIVRSTDGPLRAATGVTGTQSLQAQRQTAVIFEEYGDNLYLDRVLLEGDTSGVAVLRTKAEKRAEEIASVVGQRSISASGQ
jgi:hypothetical protein